MFFDEAFPDFEERASYAAFTTAVRTAEPFWGRGICELDRQKNHVKLERTVLPLADDHDTVAALLIMSLIGKAANRRANGPEPSTG